MFLPAPILAVFPATVSLMVAAEEAATDWTTILLNGGPFAIVVLLIILDKLTTTGERDRLRAENKELRDEVKVLNTSIRDEVVPPLVRLNGLIADVIEALAKVRYQSDDSTRHGKQ
jgi:hypothetical protein